MTSVEQLIEEHDMLEVLAVALEHCVANPAPDPDGAIASRARLSLLLAEHLAGEDAAMYPRLASSGKARLVGVWNDFQHEMIDLAADWQAYLTEWSDDVVADDWEGFGQETRAIMKRLRARIARENACLIPLALQNSMVPLRAA